MIYLSVSFLLVTTENGFGVLFMMKYIGLWIFLVASPLFGMRVMVAQMPAEQERQEAPRAPQASIVGRLIDPGKVNLTDKQFDELSARISRDAAKIVGQKAIHSIAMKAYRYREALLPALFLWRYSKGFSGMFDYMAARIEAVAKVYRENNAIASTLPSKTILSINFLSNPDKFLTADLRNPVTDYVKMIGRSLGHNEVAIVGYADGTHEIKLSEIDRGAAHNLSHDQLDCLIDLYRAPKARLLTEFKRYEAVLRSLPLNMQITLAMNYNIPFESFMEEYLSDTYRTYAGIIRDVEEAKRQKAIIELERATIRDQISYEKRDHERAMENERAKQAQRKEELRNRPFWKRHGRTVLTAVAAFAVGWLGKSYWTSVSSGISSWFGTVKSKYGYR